MRLARPTPRSTARGASSRTPNRSTHVPCLSSDAALRYSHLSRLPSSGNNSLTSTDGDRIATSKRGMPPQSTRGNRFRSTITRRTTRRGPAGRRDPPLSVWIRPEPLQELARVLTRLGAIRIVGPQDPLLLTELARVASVGGAGAGLGNLLILSHTSPSRDCVLFVGQGSHVIVSRVRPTRQVLRVALAGYKVRVGGTTTCAWPSATA